MAEPEIVWEDPPPSRARQHSGAARRAAMKANPGRWLRRSVGTQSIAPALMRDGFEITTRRLSAPGEPIRNALYARWPEGRAGESEGENDG